MENEEVSSMSVLPELKFMFVAIENPLQERVRLKNLPEKLLQENLLEKLLQEKFTKENVVDVIMSPRAERFISNKLIYSY
jgi:hypothetical protein